MTVFIDPGFDDPTKWATSQWGGYASAVIAGSKATLSYGSVAYLGSWAIFQQTVTIPTGYTLEFPYNSYTPWALNAAYVSVLVDNTEVWGMYLNRSKNGVATIDLSSYSGSHVIKWKIRVTHDRMAGSGTWWYTPGITIICPELEANMTIS